MDTNLVNQLHKLINKNYTDIYVVNIVGDTAFKYEFNLQNELVMTERITYTDFIEKRTSVIHKDDVTNYFNSLAINKLEEEMAKGNQETKVTYRKQLDTGEYRWYVNIINYLPYNGNKLIFMMSEDISERLIDSELKTNQLESEVDNYKERLQSESESMAEALYQVNNILEQGFNAGGQMQMKDTRNYINTVFNNASLSHPELNKALSNKLTESSNYKKPSILIVDDSSIIRNSLKRIFEIDYDIIFAKNGNEAINIISENVINSSMTQKHENIVGILLDLVMPVADGFVVLNFMKNFNLFTKIPVAIISGDETKETRKKVYEYEIVDMLEKPFNTDTIRRRIGKIINLYMSSNNLQNIVAIQDKELNSTDNNDSSEGLKLIINQVVNNVLRTDTISKLKQLVRVIAVNLANNNPEYGIDSKMINAMENTCGLYNVGSIAIKDDEVITAKTIKQEIDYSLAILDVCVNKDELEVAKNIAKYSCEMFNGTGYPNKISGNDIPIEAQITNLAVRIIKNDHTRSIQTAIKSVIDYDSSKYNPDLIRVLDLIKKDIKLN